MIAVARMIRTSDPVESDDLKDPEREQLRRVDPLREIDLAADLLLDALKDPQRALNDPIVPVRRMALRATGDLLATDAIHPPQNPKLIKKWLKAQKAKKAQEQQEKEQPKEAAIEQAAAEQKCGVCCEKDKEPAKPTPTPKPDEKPEPDPPSVVVGPDKLAILEPVHFALDKYDILPKSSKILKDVGTALKNHPEIKKVRVEGHTDVRASDAYNQTLSENRVKSVVNWLVDKEGIDPDRLIGEGFGESRPLIKKAKNEAEHFKNRRVEFVITDGVVQPKPKVEETPAVADAETAPTTAIPDEKPAKTDGPCAVEEPKVEPPAPKIEPTPPPPEDVKKADPVPEPEKKPTLPVTPKEIVVPPILFDFDKDTLTKEGKETVQMVASTLEAHPELKKVGVEGHTDERGKLAYNQGLSERRARRVHDHLVTEDKIPAARLAPPVGFGETRPKHKNAKTEKQHHENRRVEFPILDGNDEAAGGGKQTQGPKTTGGKGGLLGGGGKGPLIKLTMAYHGSPGAPAAPAFAPVPMAQPALDAAPVQAKAEPAGDSAQPAQSAVDEAPEQAVAAPAAESGLQNVPAPGDTPGADEPGGEAPEAPVADRGGAPSAAPEAPPAEPPASPSDRSGNVVDPDAERRAETVALVDRIAPRLGLSPSAVEVRVDDEAARRTAAAGAPGLLADGTIWLDPKRFDPETRAGQHVLAHEMAHVAQTALPSDGRAATTADAEADAGRFADSFVAGGSAKVEVPLADAARAAYSAPDPELIKKASALQQSVMKQRADAMELQAKAKKDDAPPKVTDKPKEKPRDAVEDFEDGLDATIDTLEDLDRFEKVRDQVKEKGADKADVSGLKDDNWNNLVDMFKGALENKKDGPKMRAVWRKEWSRGRGLFSSDADAATYDLVRTKIEADAHAKIRAEKAKVQEELDAARKHQQAASKGVPNFGGPTPNPVTKGGRKGFNEKIDAKDIVPVPEQPTIGEDFAKAEARHEAFAMAQREFSYYESHSTAMAEGAKAGPSRLAEVGAEFGKGFLEGLGGGVVSGAKDKFLTNVVGGGLDKIIQKSPKFGGAMRGVPLVGQSIKLAQSGLLSGFFDGDFKKGAAQAFGAEKGKKAKEGVASISKVWSRLNGAQGSDWVGLVVKLCADVVQLVADVFGFISDILSTIETICWVVGGLFIILGICFAWLGLGFLVMPGFNLCRLARIVGKVNKVVEPIAKGLAAFAAVLRVISALTVPSELYAAELAAAGEAGVFFGEKTGELVADKTAEKAKERAAKEPESKDEKVPHPAEQAQNEGAQDGKRDAHLVDRNAADKIAKMKADEAAAEFEARKKIEEDQAAEKAKEKEQKPAEQVSDPVKAANERSQKAQKKFEESQSKKANPSALRKSKMWKLTKGAFAFVTGVDKLKEAAKNTRQAMDVLRRKPWKEVHGDLQKTLELEKQAADELRRLIKTNDDARYLLHQLNEAERKVAQLKGDDADPEEIKKLDKAIEQMREDPAIKDTLANYDRINQEVKSIEERVQAARDAERSDVQGALYRKQKEHEKSGTEVMGQSVKGEWNRLAGLAKGTWKRDTTIDSEIADYRRKADDLKAFASKRREDARIQNNAKSRRKGPTAKAARKGNREADAALLEAKELIAKADELNRQKEQRQALEDQGLRGHYDKLANEHKRETSEKANLPEKPKASGGRFAWYWDWFGKKEGGGTWHAIAKLLQTGFTKGWATAFGQKKEEQPIDVPKKEQLAFPPAGPQQYPPVQGPQKGPPGAKEIASAEASLTAKTGMGEKITSTALDPGATAKSLIVRGLGPRKTEAYHEYAKVEASPINPADLQKLWDKAAAEAELNVKYHARAYNCYVMEVAVATKAADAQSVAASVGQAALDNAAAQEAVIAEGQSNEQQRKAKLAGNDPKVQPADGGFGDVVRSIIELTMKGGDQVEDAPKDPKAMDPSEAQNKSSKETKEAQAKNLQASDEQAKYLAGLRATQQQITGSIANDKTRLEGKSQSDFEAMLQIRTMKEENRANAEKHHAESEASAKDYNTGLDQLVLWAADHRAKREKAGFELEEQKGGK